MTTGSKRQALGRGLAALIPTAAEPPADSAPRAPAGNGLRVLDIEGILLCMVDLRQNLTEQVSIEVRNHFGEKVYETPIPRNVRLSEAPSFGKPILLYDVASKGAKSYMEAAREFLTRHTRTTEGSKSA